jgi:hypothetical protein
MLTPTTQIAALAVAYLSAPAAESRTDTPTLFELTAGAVQETLRRQDYVVSLAELEDAPWV